MKNKEKGKIIIAIITIIFLLAPSVVPVSATTCSLQVEWPTLPVPGAVNLQNDCQLHFFVKYIYEWGVALGGLAVFIVFIYAGFQYLLSAGDPGKMTAALGRVKSGILGLFLLLTSWIILNTINPEITSLREVNFDSMIEELQGFNIRLDNLQEEPCFAIILYTEEDHKGDKKVWYWKEGEPGYQHDGLIRVTGGGSGGAIAQLSGSNGWVSAQSLVPLSNSDKNLIEEGIINIQRYDILGNKNDFGNYKTGGSCLIDLSYRTGIWWTADDCGGRLARVQTPSNNFWDNIYKDEAVACVELKRKIPSRTFFALGDCPAGTEERPMSDCSDVDSWLFQHGKCCLEPGEV